MKYDTDLCKDDMSFEDCELAILRHAVDETDILQKQKIANSDDVKRMIQILEDFLIKKKLICYGGTAINNILPKYAQFYDRDVEVPDYDFFSMNALEDAKELTDIFYAEGYSETEAKSGVHKGTYKVFVNYIPMADITQLHPQIYKSLQKETISVAGIKYCPPNYLRMSMFLELSRPAGDVSRWEKVLKRLTLLNKYHPLKPQFNCGDIDFQRKTETLSEKSTTILYHAMRDSCIEQGVVFFGGYAASLYSRFMEKDRRRFIKNVPDFDIIAEDPDRTALIIRERLEELGFKKIQTVKYESIDDVIPEHIQFIVGKETLAFIFKPIACYSYNTIKIGSQEINVATIDTMLSFYLAFIYSDRPYFDNDRILCMAQFLFDVEQNNRLNQKGLLKRFTVQCYGKQPTLESIRAEKAEKFKELKNKKNSAEWNSWFFKYSPNEKKEEKISEKKIKKEIANDSSQLKPVSPKEAFIDPSEKNSSTESAKESTKESKKDREHKLKSYIKFFIDPRSYTTKSERKSDAESTRVSEPEISEKIKTVSTKKTFVKTRRNPKNKTLRHLFTKKRRGYLFNL
jgi:hypothetical protein